LSDEAVASAEPPVGVVIPASAVVAGQVLVLSGETVRAQQVKVAETIGANVRVESGLNPGDQVVVAPPPELLAGSRVRIQ
jgi:hypothetical protein